MNRVNIIFMTSILVLGQLGCITNKTGSTLAPTPPANRPEEQSKSLWKVKLTSTCTNDTQEKCLAGYGFSVLQDGKYEIGPGPQGQIYSQKLDPSEFQSVSDWVTKLLLISPQENGAGEICLPRIESESKDDLIISHLGQENKILSTNGSEFCFHSKSVEDSESLHNAIQILAKKYYLLPFPDSCRDSAAETEALYPSLTQCSKDSDCAYLDPNYLPIASGERRFITTDDCTALKPLFIANASLTLKSRAQLLGSKRKTVESCGTLLVRIGCREILGFYSGETGPACVNGSCQVNPSIQ